MCCFVFEEDILMNRANTVTRAYTFLNLDATFTPSVVDKRENKRHSWMFLLLTYYTRHNPSFNHIVSSRLSQAILNRLSCVKPPMINPSDIDYLRSVYLPEKHELETMLNRRLDCWKYGADKLPH
jgi:hypothetical protein